jgi:hypothetical protein
MPGHSNLPGLIRTVKDAIRVPLVSNRYLITSFTLTKELQVFPSEVVSKILQSGPNGWAE